MANEQMNHIGDVRIRAVQDSVLETGGGLWTSLRILAYGTCAYGVKAVTFRKWYEKLVYPILNYALVKSPEAIAAVRETEPRKLPPGFPNEVFAWKDEPPVPNEAEL